MMKFWAHTHVGQTTQFLGESWEEGGFSVDGEGNPTHDERGNTVKVYSADPVMLPDDAGLVRDAYAGDERVGDRETFSTWLAEQGFDGEDICFILKEFADELTDTCAYCGRAGLHRESVPAAGDDEAWAELEDEHEPDCEWLLTRAHRRELA